MYLMRKGTHRTRALHLESRRRTAACKLVFLGWHNSEMFTALSKNVYFHFVFVPPFAKIERLAACSVCCHLHCLRSIPALLVITLKGLTTYCPRRR